MNAMRAIEMPPGGVLTCLTRQAGWRGETIALERSGGRRPPSGAAA
jgi:malonate decarboxylase epsilon subunit